MRKPKPAAGVKKNAAARTRKKRKRTRRMRLHPEAVMHQGVLSNDYLC